MNIPDRAPFKQVPRERVWQHNFTISKLMESMPCAWSAMQIKFHQDAIQREMRRL